MPRQRKNTAPLTSTAVTERLSNIQGNYIGQVTNNQDSTYMGRVHVHVPLLGDKNTNFICLMCAPFGGAQSVNPDSPSEIAEQDKNICNAPKSYGMWTQPPEPGTRVLVSFVPEMEQGFVIGVINNVELNHMMGGRASHHNPDKSDNQPPFTPTSEVKAQGFNNTKVTDTEFANTLKTQGLDADFTRGHSFSSARRETPSRVFGITTRDGHVLTMDDGDVAGQHANIRLRSRKGAQILIDDTNEFIFINNHNGDSWIEMDKDGNIDIYSKGSVSVHAEKDYNIHANGNVNIQANEGVNIKSTGLEGIKIESSIGNIDIYSGDTINTEAWSSYNVTADHYKETAVRIDMNGPVADKATKAQINQLVNNTNILTSISNRVPEKHPWNGPIAKQTTCNISVEGKS
jgi:hypothetical protein